MALKIFLALCAFRSITANAASKNYTIAYNYKSHDGTYDICTPGNTTAYNATDSIEALPGNRTVDTLKFHTGLVADEWGAEQRFWVDGPGGGDPDTVIAVQLIDGLTSEVQEKMKTDNGDCQVMYVSRRGFYT